MPLKQILILLRRCWRPVNLPNWKGPKMLPVSDEGDFGENFPGYTWKLETEDASFDSSDVWRN